ncbi:DUF4044 domain-containing protein [Enterococcus nangangensis]
MNKKKNTTTFQKITKTVVWIMLVLTIAGVILTTLAQTGVL